MTGSPPEPPTGNALSDVASDLAGIEARLRKAQSELDVALVQRREALERLETLHHDRLAQQAARDAVDQRHAERLAEHGGTEPADPSVP